MNVRCLEGRGMGNVKVLEEVICGVTQSFMMLPTTWLADSA